MSDFQDTQPMQPPIKLIDTTPVRSLAAWVPNQRAKDFEDHERRRLRDRNEFKRETFLAVLPSMLSKNWMVNGKPAQSIKQRITLAWSIARQAADLES